MGRKQKIVLPPDLPPEVPDEEVEVFDEDLQFIRKHKDYARFVSNLDTKSITKHVTRVADAKEDALEAMYERRLSKKSVEQVKDTNEIEIDPVDALPVKTLDGKLYYRCAPKTLPKPNGDSETDAAVADEDGPSAAITRLTKAEKRAKQKKERKEAKKQAKVVSEAIEVEQPSKAELLDEVKKELTAEEATEKKKYRLAELGTALLVDPETSIKSLKEMLEISKDADHAVVMLGLKSLLAVFKDIIPGYRIRLPTEKEQEMMVSKSIKKTRLYESTLLSSYKAYIQRLISLEKQEVYKRVAVRCLCTLLESAPHFNFRETLLAAVVRNISSPEDVIRKQCCAAVKSLFLNEGKHGGEATVEAVRMIADLVKAHSCQLHPDSIEVFMSLSFDEELFKEEKSKVENNKKGKISKKKRKYEEQNKLQENEKKRNKQEIISRTREEVKNDYKAASFAQDIAEKGRMQSEIISAVFQAFFRILKHAIQPSSEAKATDNAYGSHPLLAPCLNGIGKLSHFIDLDFMPDLMNHLKKLAGSGNSLDGSENSSQPLTVSERLQCCIVAFKVMKSNLDALNVDLQEFFVQLYCLVFEYRPGRDKGEVLAEALKIMLCDDRQHDMQRAAAFIKRLATFSLCFGSAESMAALVTLNHLLLKNTKCRNLLENDEGGGSVAGGIAKYQPYALDPNRSGALASVLWELNLLCGHYHPSVSKLATSISTMNTANKEVFHSVLSPQQAFKELSLEQEAFALPKEIKGASTKRKRGASKLAAGTLPKVDLTLDRDKVTSKLSEHFLVVHDIVENEMLRRESDLTKLSLNLYKEFKKQKRRKTE